MTHIVVIGAGYSGQIAANLAARRYKARVTLVNERDLFVERVRLHQVAAGQDVRQRAISDLLRGTGAQLVVGRVVSVDTSGNTISLGDGTSLSYDVLIYALGSRADLGSVPGAAEHAYAVASVEQARALRERIVAGNTVTVVGGGLTGIEAATELAESDSSLKVRLVTGGALGERLSEKARRYLRRTFGRLGIDVRDNVSVASVRADGVELAGGEHVASDLVVWTTGFTVPELARDAGLAVDARGRMLVDDTMRSVSHLNVYGVGDAAAVHRADGQELRMACATGLPVAQQAVRAIVARERGETPKPLRFRFVNQCISLGRRAALVQFVHDDDSPREAILTGRLAALYKEMIVRSALQAQRHPTLPTSF